MKGTNVPKKLPEIYQMPLTLPDSISDKVQKGDQFRIRLGYDAVRFGVQQLPWQDVTDKMIGKTYAEMPTAFQFMRFVGPARYRFSVTVVDTDDDYTFYSGRTEVKSNVLVAYGNTAVEAHEAWCKLYKAGPMPGADGSKQVITYTNFVLKDNVRHLLARDRGWLMRNGTSALADATLSKDGCFRIEYGGNGRLVLEMVVVAVVGAAELRRAGKQAEH